MAMITEHRSLSDGSVSWVVKMEELLSLHGPEYFFREIAQAIAEKYVAEHYRDIAALISKDAVATMVMAESAAKIRETLEKKIPDKVMEVVRTQVNTEVWQRGLLGGMKRIR